MRGFDPLLAVLASGLGLAAAHAGGVPPDAIRAIAALALAAPAFLGFRRTVGRVADEAAHPAVGLVVMLVLPALFLLVLTCGTDHFVRGAWSWSAFAAGLPFALLATAVALARGFEARDADLAAGRRTLATAIAPMHAKLWLFGLTLPAYLWLVVQVGRDALPQACAAALLTVIVSLRAVRTLLEDFDDPAGRARATRLTAAAAAAHGALLIAGFLLADRLPLF